MDTSKIRTLKKWLQPGISVKRWLFLLAFGLLLIGIGFAQAYALMFNEQSVPEPLYTLTLGFLPAGWRVAVAALIGGCAITIALYELNNSILQPIAAQYQKTPFIDIVTQHHRLQRGLRVAVIGGGTGLPSVLRGMKNMTTNITAIVTMADDGGSSGRLRREMNVPPPGDLRNNIAALSDDEDMMTRLFQYRFGKGSELGGHSFGNLFLTALSDLTGSMEEAVSVAGRVLAIRGRVLPSTPNSVNLAADVRLPDGKLERVYGESNIPEAGGKIERVFLEPDNVQTLPEVTQVILNADLIVIGPGSLYTSIMPNLLIRGIVEALRVTNAEVVYICNIAEQLGETDGYTVAEHVEAIEQHTGASVIKTVLANNYYPPQKKGDTTSYIQPAPQGHGIYERYRVVMADLTDAERPWRHDSAKLLDHLLRIQAESEAEKGAKPINRTA